MARVKKTKKKNLIQKKNIVKLKKEIDKATKKIIQEYGDVILKLGGE